MPAPKTPDQHQGRTAPQPASQSAGRKPWKKKSPVDVVLEQEDKLRKEIAEAETELSAKKLQLQKFEQARKLFEGS